MSFLVIGMSHHHTPAELRQQYALSQKIIEQFLSTIASYPLSLVILSTCNRLEIYTENMSIPQAKAIWSRLLAYCNCSECPTTYTIQGRQSLEHTFKVVLGLDSRILREHHVVGQIRRAFQASCSYHVISQGLRRLFESCLHLSKSIRSKWQKASLGLLASKYLAPIANNRPILIIGAGEIVRDFVSYSDIFNGSPIFLCNRTYENAVTIAKNSPSPIAIVPYSELFEALQSCPIVIIGISTSDPFLGIEHFSELLEYDLLDFGLPSILKGSVHNQKKIRLKSLDSFANAPLERDEECNLWLKIQQAIAKFEQDMAVFKSRHLIVNYREKLTDECSKLTQQALDAHDRGEDPNLLIRRLAYKMQQKLLHWPSIAFKQSVLESHHLDSFYHSADAITLSSIKSFESL